jgi:phosphogluconate dehydratase
MSNLHPAVQRVTERVIERSANSRAAYLALMAQEGERHKDRTGAMACSNLAHGFAAADEDKAAIANHSGPNIGIISAYNDTISAHQPYGAYPPRLKLYAREVGATAQVGGATPAMCDGVTQGAVQPRCDRAIHCRRPVAPHV